MSKSTHFRQMVDKRNKKIRLNYHLEVKCVRQKTLFFLKPDAVVRQHVGAKVLEQVLELGCRPKTFTSLRVSRRFLANKHYYVHRRKSFFEWLLDFVTFGKLIVLILEGENIISKVRETLGPATIERAILEEPTSLRARYGMFEGINLAHASDSITSAREEISSWSANFHLREDVYALQKLEMYVSKNLKREYVDTELYRSLAGELKKHPDRFAKIRKSFVDLLSKENTQIGRKSLESFTEVTLAAIHRE